MTVKELKQLLDGVPDEMEVLIPTGEQFDGVFRYPCVVESGVSEMGMYDEEEEAEAKLLGKEVTKESFLLVPCGYFDIDHEVERQKELN